MERGKGSLDALLERALPWCSQGLPVEPVPPGRGRRTVHARDSSAVVRLRAKKPRCALLGKGYCHRAQRAVPANIVAALTTGVRRRGLRVGRVRRTRLGAPCPAAVAQVFAARPQSAEERLFSVEAGRAPSERFQAATECAALGGRLRKNVTPRRAPPPRRPGKRGRPALHGPVWPPGAQRPGGRPDEDPTIRSGEREGRGRRWRALHGPESPQTLRAVVRGDHPAYKRPLLMGTTAQIRTA
jgi:hypothetical protein